MRYFLCPGGQEYQRLVKGWDLRTKLMLHEKPVAAPVLFLPSWWRRSSKSWSAYTEKEGQVHNDSDKDRSASSRNGLTRSYPPVLLILVIIRLILIAMPSAARFEIILRHPTWSRYHKSGEDRQKSPATWLNILGPEYEKRSCRKRIDLQRHRIPKSDRKARERQSKKKRGLRSTAIPLQMSKG